MSKGSKIVPVRIPSNLLEQIESAKMSRRKGKDKLGFSLGAWIKQAIREKLDHIRRSKKSAKPELFRCSECGKMMQYNEIVCQWRTLLGESQYRCSKCDKAKP